MPALVAAGAALLYLSWPAARYNFDGVACAIAVELGDLRRLVHGNHLAYGFLGWLWFSLWKALGYAGPALQSLQALSSFLGAAGAGAFALLLLRAGAGPGLAAAGASALAVSDLYWRWSLEAQVYPLGAVCLFLAAAEGAREEPDGLKLGLWHAGAVLGHVGHVMFLPAACWLLRNRRQGLWRYAGALGSAVLAAYGAAGLFIMRPGNWEDIRYWLAGSAILGVDQRFVWHGGYSLAGLWHWLRLSVNLWGGGAVIGALALSASAAGARLAWRGGRRLTVAALLWLGGYAVLYLSWEPYTPVYRVTDLAPLWLLVVLGAGRLPWREPAKACAVAVCAVGLGLWNLAATALPGSDPTRNPDLQRVLRLSGRIPENAWVLVDNVYQVYVPYFVHRRPLNLRYWYGREAALRERLADLQRAGEPVFADPAMAGPLWHDWLELLPKREAARDGDGVLYLIE